MKYKALFFLLCAATLVWISPAQADRKEMTHYSMELPSDWEELPSDEGSFYRSPEDSVFVTYVHIYENFKLDPLLARLAEDAGIAKLPALAGGYVWVNANEDRCWLGIGKDGYAFQIEVGQDAAKQVAPVLASLQSVPDFPQFADLLKAPNKEIVDWLSFKTPDIKVEEAPEGPEVPESAAEPERTVPFGGKKIEVCKGWTVRKDGKDLTLISPDPNTWVSAHIVSPNPGYTSSNDFEQFSKKVIREKGGFNIESLSARTEFQLPDGVRGELRYCEPKEPCLMLTYKGNPAVLDIARTPLLDWMP